MLCQKCGVKPATTHIRTSINGAEEEWMLCGDCAARLGYDSLGSLSSLFTGGLLGSLLAPDLMEQAADHAVRCPVCGTSFEEIARSGLVGCGTCYQTFAGRLTPTIEKIHGKAGHVGKAPAPSNGAQKTESPLEQLKQQLAQAIETQAFEQAAKLRDQIRALEEEESHDQG